MKTISQLSGQYDLLMQEEAMTKDKEILASIENTRMELIDFIQEIYSKLN